VEHPLSEDRHQDGTDGVQEHKGDGHDNTVGTDESTAFRLLIVTDNNTASVGLRIVVGATRVARGARVARATTAAVTTGRDKGVGVSRDGGLLEVDPEDGITVMLAYGGVLVIRIDGATLLPGGDPRSTRAGKAHGSTIPALAVGAHDVGAHGTSVNTRASKQSKVLLGAARILGGRHVVCSLTRRDGYIACTIGVHDEHVRAGHAAAGSKRSPCVRSRGLNLKVDVSAVGVGRSLGNSDAVADRAIVGAGPLNSGRGQRAIRESGCLKALDIRLETDRLQRQL
jgi:hypothetical protein